MEKGQTQLLTRDGPAQGLGDRTAQIVALRDQGLLLLEIADRVGVTKERVRQILVRARAMGVGPKPPQQIVTRQASKWLGLSPEMRPGSFRRLMAKFGIGPVADKRGRLYWSVESLSNIEPPHCVVCGSAVPLGRYSRSLACSRRCSMARRSRNSSRRRKQSSGAGGEAGKSAR